MAQNRAQASPTEGKAAHVEVLTNDRPGADFMLDVAKSLGIEFCAANPASSCRGLHESMINYGGNQMPELLTCCDEESLVARRAPCRPSVKESFPIPTFAISGPT